MSVKHVRFDLGNNQSYPQPADMPPAGATPNAPKRSREEKTKNFIKKYIYSLPYTKETTGKKLNTKHYAGNALYATLTLIALPFSLPISSLMLTYTAYKEAKIVKKGLQALEALSQQCRDEGLMDDVLEQKVANARIYTSYVSDKPQIRRIKEAYQELSKRLNQKNEETNTLLSEAIESGVQAGAVHKMDTVSAGNVYIVGESLRKELSKESLDIIEGRRDVEPTLKEKQTAINEMKAVLDSTLSENFIKLEREAKVKKLGDEIKAQPFKMGEFVSYALKQIPPEKAEFGTYAIMALLDPKSFWLEGDEVHILNFDNELMSKKEIKDFAIVLAEGFFNQPKK